jgi:UDP-N-acetylmuramoyl-L-alanyl-D-glutamate--2,6-diaminopimelate ligase
VTLSLAGVHNVSNALAAAATARAAGIASDAVVAGLSTPVIVPGRMERVDVGQPFEVLVDYAHTPDALSSVLDAARELTAGRLIVVFGCGGDRDREKRPLMGAAVASRADLAILTSDNPRSERPDAIAAAVLDGMAGGSARVVVEIDRRVAIESANEDAAPGDVVVIAGKGHESGQTIGEQTFPFDDRVVARAELERSRWS